MINTFRTKQGASAVYTATMKDELGVVIALTDLTTLKLTLYNADVSEPSPVSGNIINSRTAQDVKNTNNVTVHTSSGLITWSLQVADNPIIDETKATELHIARFDFTYGSPTKTGSHEVRLRVENIRKLP